MTKNIQNKDENGSFQNGGHLEPEVKLKLTLTTQNGSEANGKLYQTINTVKLYTDNLILLSRIENM